MASTIVTHGAELLPGASAADRFPDQPRRFLALAGCGWSGYLGTLFYRPKS